MSYFICPTLFDKCCNNNFRSTSAKLLNRNFYFAFQISMFFKEHRKEIYRFLNILESQDSFFKGYTVDAFNQTSWTSDYKYFGQYDTLEVQFFHISDSWKCAESDWDWSRPIRFFFFFFWVWMQGTRPEVLVQTWCLNSATNLYSAPIINQNNILILPIFFTLGSITLPVWVAWIQE